MTKSLSAGSSSKWGFAGADEKMHET